MTAIKKVSFGLQWGVGLFTIFHFFREWLEREEIWIDDQKHSTCGPTWWKRWISNSELIHDINDFRCCNNGFEGRTRDNSREFQKRGGSQRAASWKECWTGNREKWVIDFEII